MNARSLVLRPDRRNAAADQAINDFQSHLAEIMGAPYNPRLRLTVHAFVLMVVIAIALIAIVQLDRVVSAQGRLVSRTPTLLVQPLEASVLREVLVRPGDQVTKGDVLATLDPTISTADVSTLLANRAALRAQLARLEAEQTDTPLAVPGPAETVAQTEYSIWKARQAERQARLAVFEQKILATNGQITSGLRDAEHYRSRLKVSEEIEGMRSELARKEVGSRLNVLIAQDSKAEIARNLSNSEQQVRTSRYSLESLQAEREAYLQEWRSQLTTLLATKRTELAQVDEALSKAEYRRDLVELRAAADATVVSVADVGAGSVVPSGQVLVSLMPVNAALEIEADVAGMDQGFVKVGDEVQVKLSAYDFTRYGTVRATVRSISENSFSQRDDGTIAPERYYKVRAEIQAIELRNVPGEVRLVPGMPLQADIVVGSRPILSSLLSRVIINTQEGMREP
ncbi:HlyD family type I secretion periplasmic adaptor subunit [Niveispirillum sp.]|uniref:HlyD family type I secretion periplasmic adaptor subunit n=1 Tax=Niveispirillum sp. TaxID=1917217 RepID=UPI001B6619AE|nr:HlyD family type I secretion periplasmic adaptor subunit [Niveispirillum sp.]MBP7335242.1 HlyD family type I secretion periplasmic adaptor subunit [Niveispirillum sp.]